MWPELGIRHLLALQAVAEEGTFGRAANRLGFTQSAVSQQVATLEQIVGQPLLHRPAGPKRPEATDAGKLLLTHCSSILEQLRRAEHDLDRLARGVVGQLEIGTFQSASAQILPPALKKFRLDAPDVEVSFKPEENDMAVQYQRVEDGDLDAAFGFTRPPERFATRLLGKDEIYGMVPTGFPDGPIDLASLGSQPLVGLAYECGTDIDDTLRRLGVSPNYVFRGSDNSAIQGMVEAGVGIAIMPRLTIDNSAVTIEIRSTDPVIPAREVYLFWSKERPLSAAANRFIEAAADVAAIYLAVD